LGNYRREFRGLGSALKAPQTQQEQDQIHAASRVQSAIDRRIGKKSPSEEGGPGLYAELNGGKEKGFLVTAEVKESYLNQGMSKLNLIDIRL